MRLITADNGRSFGKGREIDFIAALANCEQVLKQVLAEPDTHDQYTWFDDVDYVDPLDRRHICGTTRCVAGWSLHFAGWGMHYSEDNAFFEFRRPETEEWFLADGEEADDLFVTAARDLMGLTHEEAKYLFLQCGKGESITFLGSHIDWLRGRIAEG